MELITDLKDPRIQPDKVERTRSGARQEFRLKNKRSFDGDYYIDPPEEYLYLEKDGDGWKWVNGCAECNGKPRDWMTYIECGKHNVCRTCGCPRAELKETPWGGKNGWQCKPCASAEHEAEKHTALEAMPEEYDELDYWRESSIQCPYCNYQHEDTHEMHSAIENEETHECPRCDHKFLVIGEPEIKWTMKRIVNT